MKSSQLWVSIMEYAQYKNKSISTIRRYIKAGRIQYKVENGKYLLLIRNPQSIKTTNESDSVIEQLQQQIRILQEENSELKMLVDLYENQTEIQNMNSQNLPPELPQVQ